MGFGSFLKQALEDQVGSWDEFTDGFKEGFFGADYLRDYTHASKTFRADGHALAPQNKFLFHVYFTLNTAEIPQLAKAIGGNDNLSRIGMLVKTAKLPTYNFEIEELNQYNRKRYIQKKINYRPVSLTMHDDGSDLIRSMWYNYYDYYYNDPNYSYGDTGSAAYNNRDIYNNNREVHSWGYDGSGPNGENKPAFFKDITIYGLNRGNFTSYTLINPIITDWDHDNFDYTQGNGVMEHTMTISYEAVKYGRGKVGGKVRGFGDSALYDTRPSPLDMGAKASLFGRGGILDTGNSILEDLANGNILGAIRSGGSLRNALKGQNIKSLVASDLVSSAVASGLNFISGGGSSNYSSPFSIPSLGSNFSFGSFGGGIVNTSTLFGGTNFSSLNTSLSNSIPSLSSFGTNTFDFVSSSVNSLKSTFAPNIDALNRDFNGVFQNIQNSLSGGMPVLENALSEVSDTVSTSVVPNITSLQSDIPSADSLKKSVEVLSPVAADLNKSFAPVLSDVKNTFTNNIDTTQLKTITNDIKNNVGNVFSNGFNIGQ